MKKNERAAAIVRTIVVSLIAVLFVVPLVWMVLSSLKTAPEVLPGPSTGCLPGSSGKTTPPYG